VETEYTVLATKALPDERGSPGYAGPKYHRATSLLYRDFGWCNEWFFFFGDPTVDSTLTWPDNSESTASAQAFIFAVNYVGILGPPVGEYSLASNHVVKTRWCLISWISWLCIDVGTIPLGVSGKGAQKFPPVPVPQYVCQGNLYDCQTAEQLSGHIGGIAIPIPLKARPGQTTQIIMLNGDNSVNSTATVLLKTIGLSPSQWWRVKKGSVKGPQGNSMADPTGIETCSEFWDCN
jgi:hypothetical protein